MPRQFRFNGLQIQVKTMKEAANKLSIQLCDSRVPQSESFVKKMECMGHSLEHEKRLQVQKAQEKTENLQIRNYFSCVDGDKLMKLTEIQFQNNVLKIFNAFSFGPLMEERIETIKLPSPQIDRAPSYTKKLLINKQFGPSPSDAQDAKRSRDTKNVVKNIFRLYQNWVVEHSPSELQLGPALEQLMSKNGKYNNNLIISLSKEPLLRKSFQSFIRSQGEESIGKSRIQDKKSHLQALKRYDIICEREEREGDLRVQNKSQSSNQMQEVQTDEKIEQEAISCKNS